MAINRGGGIRGGGDVPIADAGDTAPTNLITNRNQFDYPINTLTTEQINTSPVDLTQATIGFETDQYYVVGVGADALFVNQYISGERQDAILQASIPFTLRRSFWDGVTLNGWTYRFTSYGTRIRTSDVSNLQVEEILYPAYQPGEVIYCTRSNTSDGNSSLLVDLNDAGRNWMPYTPRSMVVQTVGQDVLICSALEDATELFTVAKPHTLRFTGWHGQTVAGITYSYQTNQTRLATQAGEDDEDQLVIPPYIEGQSEIVVGQMCSSFGFGDQATVLYDINSDARAWALAP